jgi:retron-type reverse transcriptase
VRGLQIRIAKATRDQDWRRVKSLQRFLVNSYSAKALAVKRVSENDGKRTPGVDDEIWTTPEAKWRAIQRLDSRGLRPQPLRRVYIPKRGSTTKKRPLGIPVMIDRAQQALYLQGLEPVAETRADPHSYGFRRNRGTQDAIAQVFNLLARKTSASWILEGDIKGCFDNFGHGWLKSHTPMDTKVLSGWLNAGYVESGKLFPTAAGTPQGGIASPTIANIALDGLETMLTERFGSTAKSIHQFRVRLVRYADDCAPRRRGGEFYVLALNALKQPCCTRDEGRPLGPGLQDLGSNHRMLLRSNGRGGERDGKGRARPCQVSVEKTSESKPPMNCRKRRNDVKTRRQSLFWDQLGGNLFIAQAASGGRGGVNSTQALVWNVGTCVSMRREQLKRTTRESLSTEAGHRGGVACSSDEGSVMGLERRRDTVQPDRKINRQREESFG